MESIQDLLTKNGYVINTAATCFTGKGVNNKPVMIEAVKLRGHTVESFKNLAVSKGWIYPGGKPK